MSFAASTFFLGTLIIAAPTSEGLVVAADSLSVSTDGKRHCDQNNKILEVESVDRTIVTSTGIPAISGDGKCPARYFFLDFRIELKKFIETEKRTAETASLTAFAAVLNNAFERVPDVHKKAFSAAFNNKSWGQLIVASFDGARSVSTVRYANIGMKKNKLTITEERVVRFSPNTPFKAIKFGHGDYVDRGLAKGTLRRYLSDRDTGRIMTTVAPVKTVKKQPVARAAGDLIKATGDSMADTPVRSIFGVVTKAVGGPVDVIFLGNDAKAERIQWKDEPSQYANTPRFDRNGVGLPVPPSAGTTIKVLNVIKREEPSVAQPATNRVPEIRPNDLLGKSMPAETVAGNAEPSDTNSPIVDTVKGAD